MYDDRPDGDIDIAVALTDDDRVRRDELQERLAIRLDRDVQLLSIADAGREPSLLADIVRDGRVLVDRDDRWRSIADDRRVLQRRADVDRRRRRRSVIDHLDDLPRQIAALETSLEPFGDDFDAAAFREALESEDPRRYNGAQTVERAFARVQGYLARLADDGTQLAELPWRSPKTGEVAAKPWFEALRDADVIGPALCTRLVRSQRDRNLLEHDYVQADADDIHAAVVRLRTVAPEFARRYARWVAPFISG